jgi:hypothetical protein
MMTTPESTSAEAFNQYLRGRLIAASNGWKNLLVRTYSEPRVEESVVYPAVAEPRIVRILSGAAEVEERELGGPWLKTRVEAGDFFLTASQSPYEVRWRAIGPEPFETMHLYLGLPVFNRAIEEAFQKDQGATVRFRTAPSPNLIAQPSKSNGTGSHFLLPMGDILNFSPRLKAEAPGKGCHLDEFGREPIWLVIHSVQLG